MEGRVSLLMRHKNQKIYLKDREHLQRLADEQENYIGRQYHLDLIGGCLTIYALPRRRVRHREHHDRDKRREKFERRN